MVRRSITESVPLAVKDFRRHWQLLLLLGLGFALMNFIMQLPGMMLDVGGMFEDMLQGQIPLGFHEMTRDQRTATFLQSGIYVMSTFVNAILWVGGLQLGLALVDGRPAELLDGVCALEHLPVALLYAAFGLAILPAYMCCFLPGLVLAAAALHWPTVAVDKSLGAVDSLGPAFAVFRDNAFAMIALTAFLMFLQVLGALCFYWGSAVTFPLSIMIAAHSYRIVVPRPVEE